MRITTLAAVAVVLPQLAVAAGTPTFTLGTVYQCANGQSFVVLACAGPADADACDVQSFQGGKAFMRGKSSRAQVLALVPRCAAQGAGSPAAASPAAGPAGVTSLHASGLRACRKRRGTDSLGPRALRRALPAPIPA